MVTIPYRLNVFGYLAHPLLREEADGKPSGNYGMMDQIAAIRWVKNNIRAFGGDPDQITIFGQSGGAASVEYLCTTDAAKGLFQRAIMQSGGGFRPFFSYWSQSREKSEELGKKYFEFMGFHSLKEARAASQEELMEGFIKLGKISLVSGESLGIDGRTYTRFTPFVDGQLFKKDPISAFLAGEHPDVDYMLGATEGEGIRTLVANLAFAENENTLGRKPPYMFYFTYVPPGAENAHHSVEHHYVFQTFLRSGRPYKGYDFELSCILSDYWTNFIKTGNPNGEELPAWTPYTAESPQVLDIGNTLTMRELPRTEEMQEKIDQLKANRIPYGLK